MPQDRTGIRIVLRELFDRREGESHGRPDWLSCAMEQAGRTARSEVRSGPLALARTVAWLEREAPAMGILQTPDSRAWRDEGAALARLFVGEKEQASVARGGTGTHRSAQETAGRRASALRQSGGASGDEGTVCLSHGRCVSRAPDARGKTRQARRDACLARVDRCVRGDGRGWRAAAIPEYADTRKTRGTDVARRSRLPRRTASTR